jgi:guanylate kinase
MPQCGNLIIVSGPSGAGKSAIVDAALKSVRGLRFSISHTTRPPRANEVDGVHYFFVDVERFQELIRIGQFLEWAQVYGNYYGTSKDFIDRTLEGGEDVVLDVDVQGARTIRTARPEAISIFILPPSFAILRARLEQRKLDKEYVIENRLKIARDEIQHYRDYDYLIINDRLERSIEELNSIILGSRCSLNCRVGAASKIVATFGGINAKNS